MTWHDVCALDDIPADRGWPVVVEGEPIAVFRQGDKLYALANVCLHIGSPVDDGVIMAGCVICPWHGWRYDLESGQHQTLVGPRPGLATYPVREKEGRVLVSTSPARS